MEIDGNQLIVFEFDCLHIIIVMVKTSDDYHSVFTGRDLTALSQANCLRREEVNMIYEDDLISCRTRLTRSTNDSVNR